MRDKYVTEEGQVNNQLANDKRKVKRTIIIIISILVIVILFFIIRSIVRSGNCKKLVNKIDNAAVEYLKDNKTLPIYEGEYVNVNLDDLISNDYLTKEEITIDEQKATAKIKVTKYKDENFVTTEVLGCSYCDTFNDKWSEEIDREPNKNTVDIIAYYNYKNKEVNKTPYTKWYSEEELVENKDFDIKVPKVLPKVPDDAEVVDVEREEIQYYSYRDKQCKYYKNNSDYTSYFSSEQPAGYAKKDDRTLKYTEPTPYSLNYPEEKTYRKIDKKTGFKFYYLDGKKEVYYKNGEYAVESDLPEDHEYVKDRSKGSASMYSYKDQQWKWYNGNPRIYSSLAPKMPKNYNYIDTDFCEYTNWSRFSERSNLTNENSVYREQQTKPMYKYRLVHEIYSLEIFDKYVTLKEFEEKTGSSIKDLYTSDTVKVSVKYKFRVKR